VRELFVDAAFDLALVVDGVEADDALEEDVQLRVRARVARDFKERLEDVYARCALSRGILKRRSKGQGAHCG
jgi:hypothetical protein